MFVKRLFWCSLVLLMALAGYSPSHAELDTQRDTNEQLVRQKVMLVESMLERSASSKAIMESDNQEAKELLNEAKELAGIAKENLANGQLESAGEGIDEALKTLSAASSVMKKRKKSALVLRTRYKELSEGIDSFRQALDPGIEFEIESEIDPLLSDAKVMADANDYAGANKLLSQAYEKTVTAVALARDKQTVVYSLNFETAADEYDYEIRRFNGNRMIVDMMLEKRKVGSLSELVMKYVADAESVRGAAEAEAAAGASWQKRMRAPAITRWLSRRWNRQTSTSNGP